MNDLLRRRFFRALCAGATLVITASTTGCASGYWDRVAAKAQADDFDTALIEACNSGKVVPASTLIDASWDRLYLVPNYASGRVVNEALGFTYVPDDSFLHSNDTGVVGVLVDGVKVVAAFDYGVGEDGPPVEFPTPGVVLDADTLTVTPRSETSESMQEWLTDTRHQECILFSPDDAGALNH